jgi:DNA-directed RNA polymerase specialized sigma24 family protein
MEPDNATDLTRPEMTERDTTETLVLAAADAAEVLGVPIGAIRKRIERGQLIGRRK